MWISYICNKDNSIKYIVHKRVIKKYNLYKNNNKNEFRRY